MPKQNNSKVRRKARALARSMRQYSDTTTGWKAGHKVVGSAPGEGRQRRQESASQEQKKRAKARE